MCQFWRMQISRATLENGEAGPQNRGSRGDVVKVQLLENRPAPRSDEEESTEADPGAL